MPALLLLEYQLWLRIVTAPKKPFYILCVHNTNTYTYVHPSIYIQPLYMTSNSIILIYREANFFFFYYSFIRRADIYIFNSRVCTHIRESISTKDTYVVLYVQKKKMYRYNLIVPIKGNRITKHFPVSDRPRAYKVHLGK